MRLPPQKGLQVDEILINQTPEWLAQQGIAGRRMLNPANGNVCSIIKPGVEVRDRLEEANVTTPRENWVVLNNRIIKTCHVIIPSYVYL